jgi:ABC-type transport system involved in cytochrome c biogenesis ATPase subunit
MASAPPHVRWTGLRHRPGERELFHGWSAEAPPGVAWLGGDEFTLPPPPSQRAGAPSVCWLDPRTTRHDALTVREALDTVLAPFLGGDAATLQRLVQVLDLEPHLDKALYMLSAGSRRKVWLAAALASAAPVVLLDQPFAALDLASERALLAELKAIATRADRVVVLADYAPPPGLKLSARLDLDLVNRAHP